MIYTGIGARSTPKEVLNAFEYLGEELAKRNIILRSGGAEGADSAFEKGCDKINGPKEIYLPWKNFNEKKDGIYQYEFCEKAFSLAKQYHPNFDLLSKGGKALMARNSYQVLGLDLETPTNFIICYTENGKGQGGTGQALRIAKEYGIKICDFGRFPKEKAIEYANKILQIIEKEYLKEEELETEIE